MLPALSELTTMRVGGEAERLVTATTREELVDFALEAWATGDDWLVLGGGSNVVVSDAGFAGTVIRVASRGIERVEGDGVVLRVEAGEPWDALVEYTVGAGVVGHRGPERHPRLGRRRADPEHRRVRAGAV